MVYDYSPSRILTDDSAELFCMGSPTVIDFSNTHRFTRFNGRDDGLLLSHTPLSGSDTFSITIKLYPHCGGPFEQRFFHIQDEKSEDRFLMEIRMLADGSWYADTYFEYKGSSVLLQEPQLLHAPDRWCEYRVMYDGKQISQWLDGVLESSKLFERAMLPVNGLTSIGMRANKIYPFKGDLGSIELTGGDQYPANI